MDKTDKRCAILRATLDLVAERGFHGTPMALVAQRAGVAAGTIYRYFDSKDALIDEVFHYLEERFYQAVKDGYRESDQVRDRFIHIGKVFVRYCIQSPHEFQFLEQYHNSPYGVAHRREKIFGNDNSDIIYGLFNEAIRKKLVKDLPLAVLFALFFGPLITVCRDHILHFVEMDDRLVSCSVEACWDALKR